jgi:hypothetical protein
MTSASDAPTSSSPRVGLGLGRLRVLWLALGLLLALDVTCGLIVGPRTRKTSLDALLNFSAAPRPAAVLLVGNSRFRPVIADLIAEGAGAPAVNLAFNGGGFDASSEASRRFLTAGTLRAAGTRLALIGTGEVDVNDSLGNPILAVAFWDLGDFFRHLLVDGPTVDTRAFLYAHPPLAWSGLVAVTRNGEARRLIRDFGLRVAGVLGRPTRAAPASTPPATSGQDVVDEVLDNATAQKAPSGAANLADVPPPPLPSSLHDFRTGGKQRDALVAMIEHFRAAGVAVALVHAPVSDWFSGALRNGEQARYVALLREVGQSLDVPVFVGDRAGYGLAEDDYFRRDGGFDGHHLVGRGGRERFSRALGARIAGPLLAALSAGEPVGFARSELPPP